MNIYILSLLSSKTRRRNISTRLIDLCLKFSFYNAIDGRKWGQKNGLSGAEQACSLGHRKIYEKFLNSNDNWCCILEDDVTVHDDFKSMLDCLEDSVCKNINEASLIFLGGQEGLRQHRLYFVSKLFLKIGEYSIFRSFYSSKYIYRTCGYVLNRNAASNLIKANMDLEHRADDWNGFKNKECFQEKDIYLLKPSIIIHPRDLSSSLIKDRAHESTENSYLSKYFLIMYRLTKRIIKTFIASF